MNKAIISTIGVCLVAAVGINLLAQTRPYDQIMKDVGATFAALKKDIDSKAEQDAQQDATKLSALFKEVETFWMPLRSKEALEHAKNMQGIAQNIVGAAKADDLKRADTLYAGIGKTCKACHDRHRVQMPDKSFKIRP